MDARRMAQGALGGPQEKVVDGIAERASRRLPVSADAVRTAVGALFLLLAVRRIGRALRAGVRGA